VTDFAELERRIDVLWRRVASAPGDTALLDEIEDLLAEGYLRALQGDQKKSEATGELRLRLAVLNEHWQALRATGSA
jgi:hypothetical protein